jgi:putative transposase
VKNRRGPPEERSKRRERKSDKLGGLRGALSDEKDVLYRGVDRLRVTTSGDGDTGGRSHPEDGLSTQTSYRQKKNYGEMGLDRIRRLKQLEEENRKLKQLVADLSLDRLMLPMLRRMWFKKIPGLSVDGSWCGIWKHATG